MQMPVFVACAALLGAIQASAEGPSNILSIDLGGGVTMEFARVPPGTFLMGRDQAREESGHSVTIAREFYMGVTEVTNAQLRQSRPDYDSNDDRGGANIPFQQYIKSLKPDFNGDDQPAVYVPWEEAVNFTIWLSENAGVRARLPSEAEWEFACRAGTRTRYSWGDDPGRAHLYANTNDPATFELYHLDGPFPMNDGFRATAPAGSFLPNAFGLFDMHGNVAEWTLDAWHDSFAGAPADGSAWIDPDEPRRRVARGGSFESSPSGEHYFSTLCAGRSWNYIGNRNFGTGFRVLIEVSRDLPNEKTRESD